MLILGIDPRVQGAGEARFPCKLKAREAGGGDGSTVETACMKASSGDA